MTARRRLRLVGGLVLLSAAAAAAWGVPAPPSYTVEGMPRIGWRHVWRSAGIVRGFSARRQFAAWIGHERRMFVAAGTTNRFLRMDGPGAAIDAPGIPERAFAMQGSRDVARPWVTYALDDGGDERYRFYRYDLSTGESIALTEVPARAYAAGLDPTGRWLAFSSNQRNGVDSDIYVVAVDDPSPPRLVYDGGGDVWLSGWTPDGRIIGHRLLGIERSLSFLVDPASGEVQTLFPDLAAGAVIRTTERARQGDVVYLAADLDGEYVSLYALDTTTGATELLAPDLAWDVEDIAALPDGRRLALLVNEDSRFRLYVYDIPSGALAPTPVRPDGFPLRIHAHPVLPLLAIDLVDRAGVAGTWTYDVDARRFEAWSVVDTGRTIPEPDVVHYPTFDRGPDGQPRRISAVVLRPDEPMAHPQPVLIDIHGGPTAQALAMVQPQDTVAGPRPVIIRPNVRGSTGYGRTFAELDDRRRREDAVRDIGALLDWIATQPDLDASRVAVMGASYGGYMSLAALARYGDRLRCGVDMFGIADWPAFIAESDEGHFGRAQRGEYGDPADPDAAVFLAQTSPIAYADRFQRPVLVYQGANDIRVKPEQSRRFVERVRASGGQVAYLEVPGEGHGVSRPLTQFYFGVAMLEFLTGCLAG